MTQIIDRRLNGKHKSAVNRQRFLKRFRKQIKKAVASAINQRSITDVESSEKVVIPAKDTKEYTFKHGPGGKRSLVYPGNKEFMTGDKIARPQGSGQGGSGSLASNEGEGIDDFVFQISSEEFLDLFFDNLALPDLVKKEIATIPTYKFIRAGYTSVGVPTNINIVRSMKSALSRRIALASPLAKELKEYEARLKKLHSENKADSQDSSEAKMLEEKISLLKKRIKRIPFIDTFDLRYNNRIKESVPTTQAVMFCIMDVSGSMDKIKKDIAKRFFILLYLFLNRNYEKIEVVFIRHHTSAKEVDEHEFFYSRETGGTVVSSALSLLTKIIEERYDTSAWNIYAAQASDGDNWNADSPRCHELLEKEIMSSMQYYAYVEIMPRLHQSLWEGYLKVKERHRNFSMQTINDLKDIYPVFRELFKKEIQ